MSRYDQTDCEWRVIEPLLPNKPRGVLRVDDRRVLNGIFRGCDPVLRGATYPSAAGYAPRATAFRAGVRPAYGDRLMDAISATHDSQIQMIDSTSIRAHQQSATEKRAQIIVSVSPEVGSRPRSTSSSTRKGSRSASA